MLSMMAIAASMSPAACKATIFACTALQEGRSHGNITSGGVRFRTIVADLRAKIARRRRK